MTCRSTMSAPLASTLRRRCSDSRSAFVPPAERWLMGDPVVVAEQARSARSIWVSRRDAGCSPCLHQEGTTNAAAIKAVVARQLAAEMKKKRITKQRMAQLMRTSRAQVDRLLDPDNGGATVESLQRAAKIVGRELRMQLV